MRSYAKWFLVVIRLWTNGRGGTTAVQSIRDGFLLLALPLLLQPSMGYAGEDGAERVAPATQPWTKIYSDFHEMVGRINEEAAKSYFPEFTIVRGTSTIATIQIDPFSAQVLKEADETFKPYREGLQKCVERDENEYRPARTYSYERFGWFLDRYVRLLTGTIGGQEEPPVVEGVKEKKVSTDYALYLYTRLLGAYLEARTEKFKSMDGVSFTSDRMLLASLSDIGRRVLHLDMTRRFDRKALLETGAVNQPGFRELASGELKSDLEAGVQPLSQLMSGKDSEPACEVVLPPRKPQVAQSN